MEKVKFTAFVCCSQCAQTLNELERKKQEFLKTRSHVSRCQCCEKLRDLKPDGDEDSVRGSK